MSFSPLVFTGVSKFSEDFQTILDRAANIARLPAAALENQQKDLLQQKLLVGSLSGSVESLAVALEDLGALSGEQALRAVSSDASKVTATSVNAGSPALYTIANITSIARQAAETSLSGYADSSTAAVSSTGTVKLIVGDSEYDIDLTGANNLTALRDAINALDAGVTASVLTTGAGANPYYLSVTADSAGATTLELRDDPAGANTNLLSAANQGANTEFDLNGVHVSKTTTLINDVLPGVTLTIEDTIEAGEEVTVKIGSSRSTLASAIETFVAAFNSVRAEVNGQIGESAGLLTGDYLVREIHGQLSRLAAFQGGDGTIRALSDLGIEFNANGEAALNLEVFDNLSDQQIQDSFSFLGDTTSGLGGLSRGLHQIGDPITGLGQIQIRQYDAASARIDARIAGINQRVSDMQKSMAARLQAMDTLLSSLTSQQSLLEASIESLSFSTYGKQE
jgi:flagellar hook-associated protein 2